MAKPSKSKLKYLQDIQSCSNEFLFHEFTEYALTVGMDSSSKEDYWKFDVLHTEITKRLKECNFLKEDYLMYLFL